ncbi:hypothetical protein IDVR_00580 [Intrasporangium sp. DVR]
MLRGVTFDAPAHEVTGFLGPNGSGKSTSLRLIVGLAEPDAGSATVLGRRFRELPDPRRVGVLLDSGAFHPGRTARETLRLSARLMSINAQRAEECLDVVGLSDAAGKRVGQFSLGMRQRLGLAHALLGDPEVLILDEPANGLDPQGVRWLRTFLVGLADRGGTVLLSSQALSEVERVADRVVVLREGEVVASGPVADVTGGMSCRVRTEDDEVLSRALFSAGLTYRMQPHQGLVVAAAPRLVGAVARDAGLAVHELYLSPQLSLEDVVLGSPPPSASGPSLTKEPIDVRR